MTCCPPKEHRKCARPGFAINIWAAPPSCPPPQTGNRQPVVLTAAHITCIHYNCVFEWRCSYIRVPFISPFPLEQVPLPLPLDSPDMCQMQKKSLGPLSVPNSCSAKKNSAAPPAPLHGPSAWPCPQSTRCAGALGRERAAARPRHCPPDIV